MSLRSLFAIVAIALWIGLGTLPALSQTTAESVRDLHAVVAAKVLRVAVTRFDLPSFHVRGSDGKLRGPEIEMAQQIGRALGVRVEFVDDAESFDGVVDFVALG